jgi:hypothetical protein
MTLRASISSKIKGIREFVAQKKSLQKLKKLVGLAEKAFLS